MPHALIEPGDLSGGRKGRLTKMLTKAAIRILSIDRVNRLYSETYDSGRECAAELLRMLGTTYSLSETDYSRIPRTGGAIIVANHPTGALDGVLLIDLLSKIRADVRLLGNFLLERIDSLAGYFIPVDPFENADPARNLKGMREALRHVTEGGLLVIFPAGEVATWQKGFRQIKDKPWQRSVLKFIRKAGVPVIPVCIEGHNSKLFHLAGKIHPAVRTALLPREFANKRNLTVRINVGAPIPPGKTASLENLNDYGNFLRANVELMRGKENFSNRAPDFKDHHGEEIEEGFPREKLAAEVDSLRKNRLIAGYSDYEVYFASAGEIPCLLHEIGQQREITFRAEGEGTLKALDIDLYDAYYRHLFVWNKEKGELAGAYRLGLGDEIMRDHGLKGFYINSLFRLSKRMGPVMEKTIELGRSFVTADYQRKPVPLMLLWKGILYILLRNEQYRNLVGPVSVPGNLKPLTKAILVKYLRLHHYNEEFGKLVRPVNGVRGVNIPIDAQALKDIDSPELLSKIISDIEGGEVSMPILIRKYIQLNSRVLGFNDDPAFNDCLDAFMFLDLKRVPDRTIAMLSKELTGIDVAARFKKYRV